MTTSDVIALLAIGVALFNSGDNLFVRYVRSRSAAYAAQKDYQRLEDNQKHILDTLARMNEDMVELREQTSKIDATINFLVATDRTERR